MRKMIFVLVPVVISAVGAGIAGAAGPGFTISFNAIDQAVTNQSRRGRGCQPIGGPPKLNYGQTLEHLAAAGPSGSEDGQKPLGL